MFPPGDIPSALRSTSIVTPEGVVDGAILVRDGQIEAVVTADGIPADRLIIALDDLAVLPGAVDTHVHVNEPGRTDWEGWASASAAAAAGGVTTIVDMPLNSIPATTSVAAFEQKLAAAAGVSHVDFAFWGGLVPGNVSSLEPLAEAGVLGFKAFMIDSGVPEFAAVRGDDLAAALPVLADLDLPLLVHAELAGELLPWSGPVTSHAAWAATRPPEGEVLAAQWAASLAEQAAARLHIVHVSSPATIAALTDFGPHITAETCPHYIGFCGDDVPDRATQFKCAPPLRGAAERDALRELLLDPASRLDMVASDHSPSPSAGKCLETGDFERAWGGIASLQLLLSATWTSLPDASIVDLARLTSTIPASRFGLARKGRIAAGADADLVIFDPSARWQVDAARLHHRHPITPWHGRELRGAVVATLLRGRTIYDRVPGLAPAATGQYVTKAP